MSRVQFLGGYSGIFLLLLGALASRRLEAIELGVPLRTPRLTGVEAEFPAGEGNVVLQVTLKYDEKGKVTGEGSIDGAGVSVKGGLKKRGESCLLTASFKGISEKVSIKVSSIVGSGVATLTYRGPRGKAKLVDFPINLLIAAGSSTGTIEANVAVDAKGKITGTGRFTSGFGNDPTQEGKITGKITHDTLSLKFKAGKQTWSFKGSLEGTQFVGDLKVKAPPAKEVLQSFVVPLGDGIDLPSPGDGSHGHGDMEEAFKYVALYNSIQGTLPFGSITINKVTRSSGKRLKWALVDITFGDFQIRNPDPFEFKEMDTLPPANVGNWFTTSMWVEEIDFTNGYILKYTKKHGPFSVDVTNATPELISGTWKLTDVSTGAEHTGTWESDPRFAGL